MKAKFSRRPTEIELRRWYVEERKSTRAIEALTGASGPTVRVWLIAAGIDRRTISEAKRGQKPTTEAVLASVRARRKHVLPGRPEVGYKVNDGGYVLLWRPDHPMADGQGYVKEHRLVLAEKIGRLLRPEEDGHHRNEVRHDNDPENLELMASRAEHQREHSRTRHRDGAGRFT